MINREGQINETIIIMIGQAIGKDCVTDTYSHTSVYFTVMRKELCRSARPTYVDRETMYMVNNNVGHN